MAPSRIVGCDANENFGSKIQNWAFHIFDLQIETTKGQERRATVFETYLPPPPSSPYLFLSPVSMITTLNVTFLSLLYSYQNSINVETFCENV